MRAHSILAGVVGLLGLSSAAAVVEVHRATPRHSERGLIKRASSASAILNPLQSRNDSVAVKPGTELRFLCIGDSITLGTFSNTDGGDGNGYRLQLQNDLSKDNVVFAGTVSTPQGTMRDGYFAAWPGKTIKYISENVEPSLRQKPNIVLLHAGTNDMNPNGAISTEGNDPVAAVQRLGSLVDQIVKACPEAVVLVAMIISTCVAAQEPATREFQRLIPGMVKQRFDDQKHVMAVNLTSFPTSELRDCIHPTNQGYRLLGDYWANSVAQIPRDWITVPQGPDPQRSVEAPTGGPPRTAGTAQNVVPQALLWLFIAMVIVTGFLG
ncbi:hypothetical protein HIM_01582 [Hirsutella minnesotensis 3608]|nr:hypothetical protein HIM_01582 [Hirsutella minnesotensis 3608]